MARQLRVEIVGDTARLERAFKRASSSSEQFGGVTGHLRDQLGGVAKAFIGTAAAFEAGEFLKHGIESSEALRKAQESLRIAIEKTGGDVRKLEPQYAATAREAAKFGVTQVVATQALSRATLLTGSAEKAQRAYQEALVISKATGKDFNSVLTATSKAQEGMTGSLKRYGVILDGNASSQTQMNEVMNRFGGQAEANTSASDKLRANFENLQTSIGTLLLPAFEKIVEGLNSVVEWLQSPTVSGAFAKFAATAQAFMQPIVDWVRNNWPQIRTTVENVLNGVKDVITNITAIVKATWDVFGSTILQIARTTFQTTYTVIGDLMRAIRDVIRLITDVIHGNWSAAWDDVKGIVSNVLGAAVALARGTIDNFAAAALAIGKAFVKAIAAGLASLGGAIAAAVLGPLDAVIGKIRDVIGWSESALSAIGKIASSSAAVPAGTPGTPLAGGGKGAPGRASGGQVRAGHAYTVGELGREVFVPDTNGAIVPNNAGVRSLTVNLTVNGWVGNDQALARRVVDEINGLIRGQGAVFRAGAVLSN